MSGPIHLLELVTALRHCIPQHSGPVFAVANSGGPDSTCLLFLLRQLIPPTALLSIHVAHNLQPASPYMAAVAAENADQLGIPHHVAHVPWGVPPFPALPTSGPVERVARDARYTLLFRTLTTARASLLALGHHADDQLETAIMRLARGSSLLGAAGMPPLRRWGMGSANAWFGHQGLDTFIVRPLLSFPKHRIIATCHAHHLHYVNDPTNSQPHITTRNAIRHCLADDPPFSRPVPLPHTAPVSFDRLKNAFSLLHTSIASDVTGEKKNRLYTVLGNLAARAEHVHLQVTSHLAHHALPSPIATLLLTPSKLFDITDPDIRAALVLRVIRYISFHPWGSLPADANRRQHSIHRIVRALWASDSQMKKFTAGGGVLWSPAIFNPNRALRVGNQSSPLSLQPDDTVCWLASRLPPFSKNPQQRGAGSHTSLLIDLTDQLVAALSDVTPSRPLQVLYDCRFLLTLDPLQMPTYVKSALKDKTTASVKILPFTQYYWPKVVLQREFLPDCVLAVPQENDTSPWISIRWVRPLDPI